MSSIGGPTRRVATLVAMCLALGAATSVAVSVVIATWLPFETAEVDARFAYYREDEPTMLIWRRHGFGSERRLWVASESHGLPEPGVPKMDTLSERPIWGLPWGRLPGFKRPEDRPLGTAGLDEARGWPAPMVWAESDLSRDAASTILQTRGAVVLGGGNPEDPHRMRCVPLKPIWWGVAINVSIYAVAWAMMFGMYPVARSARRRRRGHCPACNYDLRADLPSGCPECGWNRRNPSPKGAP